VIIVDEAQFLKNSILDDLRIIFNFEMDSKDYSVLILAGQSPF
jgi:type II secretory pathway predicted ATPase ExeA